jgi:CCR4-NOT transcription complex subunit 6
MVPVAATGISHKLRVMTYNVLAQCYVRSSFFPYCNSSELRWKNRSKNLVGCRNAYFVLLRCCKVIDELDF